MGKVHTLKRSNQIRAFFRKRLLVLLWERETLQNEREKCGNARKNIHGYNDLFYTNCLKFPAVKNICKCLETNTLIHCCANKWLREIITFSRILLREN